MNGELGAMGFIDAHLVRLRQATQAGSQVLETIIVIEILTATFFLEKEN